MNSSGFFYINNRKIIIGCHIVHLVMFQMAFGKLIVHESFLTSLSRVSSNFEFESRVHASATPVRVTDLSPHLWFQHVWLPLAFIDNVTAYISHRINSEVYRSIF